MPTSLRSSSACSYSADDVNIRSSDSSSSSAHLFLSTLLVLPDKMQSVWLISASVSGHTAVCRSAYSAVDLSANLSHPREKWPEKHAESKMSSSTWRSLRYDHVSKIFTDRASRELGKVLKQSRPSFRPYPLYLSNRLTFELEFLCVAHDHSWSGVESQGHRVKVKGQRPAHISVVTL